MEYKTIIVKKENHIATLTMNRPEKLNAINRPMFQELREAVEDINEDDDIRLMVLTGAGRAFCSSADISEAGAGKKRMRLEEWTVAETRQFIRRYAQNVVMGIRNMEKPTIAMINGLAVAVGFDFALACDIRIGCEKSRFMNAFVTWGLFPSTGTTWLLPQVVGISKTLEFLYSGDWIDAEEAYKVGILNELVPSSDLEKVTMVLARKIANGPPVAIKWMKMQTYRGLEMSMEQALEMAADGEVLTMATDDHSEAWIAFQERRPPIYKGK